MGQDARPTRHLRPRLYTGEASRHRARAGHRVHPSREEVVVYRADGRVVVLGTHDHLDGETVLPGFRLSLAELFAAD
jgi:Uma2 family endonuclease